MYRKQVAVTDVYVNPAALEYCSWVPKLVLKMVTHIFNPSTQEAVQTDLCELEDSLGYLGLESR